MIDPMITAFFAERKKGWLTDKIKESMSEAEMAAAHQECEKLFDLKNWLPNAANRAGQISISTHPVTLSHPSARTNKNGHASAVVAQASFTPDGFLRSGNVAVAPDALGNAAALDVYKFLTLVMQDGETLLQHLQNESALATHLLSFAEQPSEVKHGFLQMIAKTEESVTSSKIKQVYFPVEYEASGYHLLSVLSPSGLVFELRKRLDDLCFSEETKTRRELRRNNEFCAGGYQEIYGLTTIGYGGEYPQNISVLTHQNRGKAHLLLSIPPSLDAEYTRLPRRDFFNDVLNIKALEEIIKAFHKLASADHNNLNIRRGLDYRIEQYLDVLIQMMWQTRRGFIERPYNRPEQLPAYQKRWLFPENEAARDDSQDWLDEVVTHAARHFSASYKKALGKSALTLGDDLMARVTDVLEKNSEVLA